MPWLQMKYVDKITFVAAEYDLPALIHCGLVMPEGIIRTLIQVMACCLIRAKSLLEPVLTYHKLDPYE